MAPTTNSSYPCCLPGCNLLCNSNDLVHLLRRDLIWRCSDGDCHQPISHLVAELNVSKQLMNATHTTASGTHVQVRTSSVSGIRKRELSISGFRETLSTTKLTYLSQCTPRPHATLFRCFPAHILNEFPAYVVISQFVTGQVTTVCHYNHASSIGWGNWQHTNSAIPHCWQHHYKPHLQNV